MKRDDSGAEGFYEAIFVAEGDGEVAEVGGLIWPLTSREGVLGIKCCHIDDSHRLSSMIPDGNTSALGRIFCHLFSGE